MTSNSTTLASKLLALPAELRNTTYRYTLCHDQLITLNRHNYTEPPLLYTCQQICREAGTIYYLENSFDISTGGFDPTVMLRFEHDARQLVDLDEVVYYVAHAANSVYYWADLLRWLKAFSEGNSTALEFGEGAKQCPLDPDHVAVKAFDMVRKLKVRLEWDQIEEVMGSYKEATKGIVDWQ